MTPELTARVPTRAEDACPNRLRQSVKIEESEMDGLMDRADAALEAAGIEPPGEVEDDELELLARRTLSSTDDIEDDELELLTGRALRRRRRWSRWRRRWWKYSGSCGSLV